jgi:formylglycine-generating enzyme required for sulfatase activity
MEDGEWGMAIMAIKRALAHEDQIADPKRKARLKKLLDIASKRLQRRPSTQPSGGAKIRNRLGISMVLIKPGSFRMGSSDSEARRAQSQWPIPDELLDPERPDHTVRITEPFLLGQYEVTVGQFQRFVSETGHVTRAEKRGWGWVYNKNEKQWTKRQGASWRNPGFKVWDDHPVTLICHEDAEAFCAWLSEIDNRRYFLPTEAQWEYAARGGLSGKRFPWGDQYPDSRKINLADRQAAIPWADRTIDDGYARLAPVGCFQPNNNWLYDMAGNAWEMCSDYYSAKAYEERDQSVNPDPRGPRRGKKRVVRGGNWAFGAGIARNSFRFGIDPHLTTDLQGFRIAAQASHMDLPPEDRTSELSPEEIIKKQGIERLLTKIKGLVAQGKRLEAKRIAEKVSGIDPRDARIMDEPEEFVSEVLKSLIDVTEEQDAPSFVNSLGMEMIQIPSGSFVMGSSEADIAWAMTTLAGGAPVSLEHEYPFHKVRISRPFYMSATEVTVDQFKKFVRETGYVTDAQDIGGGQTFDNENSRFVQKKGATWKKPGWKISGDQPVTLVSYYDALAFCEWLSAKEKLPYKLPTEAQWEYAARGGKPMKQFPWGDALPDGRKANYADSNTDFPWRDRAADDGYKYVAPVGNYEPNGFGLYDMAGNVLEWTRDYYSRDYYRYSPEVDPQGPGHGEYFVMRGGEWTFGALNLRCAFRGWSRPDMSFYNSGFRVVIDLGTPLKPFHFSADFLTQSWAPSQEHRDVARAVALNNTRKTYSQGTRDNGLETKGPEITGNPVSGVRILGFTPKSDARAAGMAIGDVIIEYNGRPDLTPDRLIALTGRTSGGRRKVRAVVVRDGFKYSMMVDPGFLGIICAESIALGPFKDPPANRRPGRGQDRKEDGDESLNWT